MQVPARIPAKQLSVTLEPFYVKVARKDGSEVYLEGSLERGIVPQESVWTHGGGAGEDGFLLLLHKMNLELLQRQVPCNHCSVGTFLPQVACRWQKRFFYKTNLTNAYACSCLQDGVAMDWD